MAVQFRDYYQILGVPRNASTEEIRSAFRRLARKYHPDVATDKKAAEEKFKEINEAYEVLGDEEKRRKYDELGSSWQQGGIPGAAQGYGGSWSAGDAGFEYEFGGTGFSDFFEFLFGSRGMSGRSGFWEQATGVSPAKGQDFEIDLLVTLEEALHGSTRRISFRRSLSSPPETYTVKIPKGIRQGQRIRLAGIGGRGLDSEGDLYLKVRFERHPNFEVSGNDLLHEVDIPVWDFVLGCEIEVPTLEGMARLKIPPGTVPGKRFRLAGRGLPGAGGKRGDYYAVPRVSLPERPPSGEERALWQRLAELYRS